ncbi:hypothetical protein JCM5350_001846 [Sporobolomyces pararoseus]
MTSLLSTSSIPSSPVPSFDLKAGDTFTIQGPSIYRDITPLDNYPPPAPDSDYPPRPLIRELVGPQGLAQSSASWEIVLSEDAANSDKCCQLILEAEINKKGTYRNLQGREVMICYGIFSVVAKGTRFVFAVYESLGGGGHYSEAGWREKAQAAEPGTGPSISFGDSPGDRKTLLLNVWASEINGGFLLLRRLLSCSPGQVPLIDKQFVAVDKSSDSSSSIHYIIRRFHAVYLVSVLRTQLFHYYKEFCLPLSIVTGPERYQIGDFSLDFSGLLLMTCLGAEADEVVDMWRNVARAVGKSDIDVAKHLVAIAKIVA